MNHTPWTQEQAEKWASIKLKDGVFTIVDLEDFERLSNFKWSAMPGRRLGEFRVVRRVSIVGQNKRKTIYLHRQILNYPDGVVDHINGDPLDNRKQNLRVCNSKLNSRNRIKNTNNKSGYKGVYFHFGKWQAQIRVDGKKIFLGTFESALAGAQAYDVAAIKHHGEYARINGVRPIEEEK